MKHSVLVKTIKQKDNHTFTIEWSDGKICNYRLSDLQKNCPCAACVDENTGKRMVHPDRIDVNVRATRVSSLGRYAIKINFTSGCSNGIYGFDYLRKI